MDGIKCRKPGLDSHCYFFQLTHHVSFQSSAGGAVDHAAVESSCPTLLIRYFFGGRVGRVPLINHFLSRFEIQTLTLWLSQECAVVNHCLYTCFCGFCAHVCLRHNLRQIHGESQPALFHAFLMGPLLAFSWPGDFVEQELVSAIWLRWCDSAWLIPIFFVLSILSPHHWITGDPGN